MNERKGFTLIELLIVIAIILILIAIALPNFLEAQIRSKVARVKSDIRSLSIAQESYYLDREVYTNDCGGGNVGCFQLSTPVAYIKDIPLDPFGVHRFGGGENNLVGELRPFYPMGTGISRKHELKLIPFPPGFNREEPPVRDAYIIYSAGPTDNRLEPGGPTGTFPQPDDSVGWVVYSPTNGTRSYGGIIRVGGIGLPPAKRLLLQQSM